MSNTIEEKTIKMNFDNSDFKQKTEETSNLLSKLKSTFSGLGKGGASTISDELGKVNMGPLNEGLASAKSGFSALEAIAVGALMNIGYKVADLGMNLAKSLTLDPIMDGFREYELMIGSVQTIHANTKSSVSDINAQLDELNRYADETIYVFSDMTKNVGTFTATLGEGSLDTSVKALKGIGNWAAYAGASTEDYSRAAFQLSQGLSQSYIRLTDWMSIEHTAGMAGKNFQNEFKKTAEAHGTNVDAMIKKQGSFRDSLKEGWLTTEVFMETMERFADDENMTKAATELKTFTQLMQTMQEEAGSGWAEMFRTIVGDYEQSVKLWTKVGNTLKDSLFEFDRKRNEVVREWADLGGRDTLLEGLGNIAKAIGSILKPIRDAFAETFGGANGEWLLNITEKFAKLTKNLKITDEAASNLKDTFRGLFSIVKLLGKGLGAVVTAVMWFAQSPAIHSITNIITAVTGGIGRLVTAMAEGITSIIGFDSVINTISQVLDQAFGTIEKLADGITNTLLPAIGSKLQTAINAIFKGLRKVFDTFKLSDIIDTGLIAGVGVLITTVLSQTTRILGKLVDMFRKTFLDSDSFFLFNRAADDFFDGLSQTLVAFETAINVRNLVAIGAAIFLIAQAMQTISDLPPISKATSLVMVIILLKQLAKVAMSLGPTIATVKSLKGAIGLSAVLVAFATALSKIADAVKTIGEVGSYKKRITGLLSVVVIMKALMKVINSSIVPYGSAKKLQYTLADAAMILAFAEATKMIADALAKLSGYKFGDMLIAVIGLVAVMKAMTMFMTDLAKIKGVTGFQWAGIGAALALAALSLIEVAAALSMLAKYDFEHIAGATTGMMIAFGTLGAVLGYLNNTTSKLGKLGMVVTSGALVVAAFSLIEVAAALKLLAGYSWGEIWPGLASLEAVFATLAGVLGAYGALESIMPWSVLGEGLGALSLVLGSFALKNIANALSELVGYNWDDLKDGVFGLVAVLSALSFNINLSSLTAIFSVFGGRAIQVGAKGLVDIATALNKLKGQTWEDVSKSIVELFSVLLTFTQFAPVLGFLGLGAGNNLKSFAEGIKVMADTSSALGEFKIPDDFTNQMNNLSWGMRMMAGLITTNGTSNLRKAAEPLKILSEIGADLSKFSVPEDFTNQMNNLAWGIRMLTFSFLGSVNLRLIGPSIGQMAEGIAKFEGLKIPDDFGEKLKSIGTAIQQFTGSMFGGVSFLLTAQGMTKMAEGIKAWGDISVPYAVTNGIGRLGIAIKDFVGTFWGGVSFALVAFSLGKLAEGIKAMNGVTVSETTIQGLKDLAFACAAWTADIVSWFVIDMIVPKLKPFAEGIQAFGELRINDGAAKSVKTVASALREFTIIDMTKLKLFPTDKLSSIADSIRILTNSMKAASAITKDSVSGFIEAVNAVATTNVDTSNLKKSADDIKSAAEGMGKSLSQGLGSQQGKINDAVTASLSGVVGKIGDKASDVEDAGEKLGGKLVSGVKSKKDDAKKAGEALASSAVKGMGGKYTDAYNAGANLSQGFADGINAKGQNAATKAKYWADRAAAALAKALEERSPSKVTFKIGEYFSMGFANGIATAGPNAVDSTEGMVDTVKRAFVTSVNELHAMASDEGYLSPTITPIMDLTNVEIGAGQISDMLSANRYTLNTMANVNGISNMFNKTNNTTNPVIDAITGLRSDITEMSKPTYNVNGVTYDDGSNIATAVGELVRAVKVERRT